MDRKTLLTKVAAFFVLAFCAFGLIGGIGATLHSHSYPCAVGVTVLAWLAWPKVKEWFGRVTA